MTAIVGGVVLGLNPGFGNCGWALVRLEPHRERILQLGVIRTRKGYKKTEVLASSDLHRRGRELAGDLALVAKRERVVAVCAEAVSWVRSAKTMHQLGRTYGMVDLLCALGDWPLVEVSPQDLKQAVCGSRSASKADIEERLRDRYPDAPWSQLDDDEVAPSAREHAFDAVGAVVAGAAHSACRMARRLTSAA